MNNRYIKIKVKNLFGGSGFNARHQNYRGDAGLGERKKKIKICDNNNNNLNNNNLNNLNNNNHNLNNLKMNNHHQNMEHQQQKTVEA